MAGTSATWDLPLVERKRAVPKRPDYLQYVDYVESEGEHLFKLVCDRDLEGIVAKNRQSRYAVEDGNPAWVKIRNPRYTQMAGKDEMFERRYEAQGANQAVGTEFPSKSYTTMQGLHTLRLGSTEVTVAPGWSPHAVAAVIYDEHATWR